MLSLLAKELVGSVFYGIHSFIKNVVRSHLFDGHDKSNFSSIFMYLFLSLCHFSFLRTNSMYQLEINQMPSQMMKSGDLMMNQS